MNYKKLLQKRIMEDLMYNSLGGFKFVRGNSVELSWDYLLGEEPFTASIEMDYVVKLYHRGMIKWVSVVNKNKEEAREAVATGTMMLLYRFRDRNKSFLKAK